MALAAALALGAVFFAVAGEALGSELRTTTPQGGTLEMRHTLEQREVPGVFPQSWAQIVRLVNDTSVGILWVSFRLEHEGALSWPRGQRVYLVLADSSMVRDSLALACEPKQRMTQRPYPALGAGPLTVAADELWRESCRGGPCTQLFVGFPRADLPRGFTLRDAAGVRVGAFGPTMSRAAPRDGGAR